jgi:two-component system sensor histidine kinase HydH
MSIRLTLRVAAPSIVISLLLLALGGLGAWYILGLQKSTAALVALDLRTMRAVQQLVLSMTEVRSELAEFLATGDRAHLEAVPAKCSQTEHWLRETEDLVDDDDEIALASQVREGFQRFLAESRGLSKASLDSQTRRTVQRLNGDLSVRGMLVPAQELLAREEEQNRKSRDYNLGMAGRIAMILGLLAVCGSAAGVVAGVGIARSVTRSIVELYVPVRVASGRLEEVVGPVDIIPSAGIENLDVLLHKMAEHVGTVVDRFQQSQLEVLRAEQMAALGHLAAGLAHELRNPLTAMKVLIQKAARATRATRTACPLGAEPNQGSLAKTSGREVPAPIVVADGLTDRDLAVLEAETARLERSIQTFLDFARPPRLEKWSGDVRQVLQQTIELVRARADQQHVQIHCDLLDRPLMIEADHEQLRQLFLNLLCNALDTLPQGGNIRIAAAESQGVVPQSGKSASRERTESFGAWLTITIADNGPGVPKELGDRIFEPYVSTKDTGIGLGLAICRRIAESHGGQITATSATEGGAVFTVHLPTGVPSDQGGMSCRVSS